MAEPFLAEIRIMSFTFPPKGWALCNGQLLPINQNQALFSLMGTTYGGDGRVNFGLPDLRGRTPIKDGAGHTLGERGGETGHTLSIQELPTHTHVVNLSDNPGTPGIGTNNMLSNSGDERRFTSGNTNFIAMGNPTSGNTGGSQAHQNMQPFLTLSFCVALQGIFPSQT
jgi:microcystin-dependent protein